MIFFKKFLRVAGTTVFCSSAMLCSGFFSTSAMEPILDPSLISSINSTLKESFPSRNNDQEIIEADVPYVKDLNAKGMGITDITGIEQFTYITSTIDLSNNDITDITPLINWAKHKQNEQNKPLEANIFIGNNPILKTEKSTQIFTLSKISPYIRIYSEKRDSGSVIELQGFADGRPVDLSIGFDDISPSSSQQSYISQGAPSPYTSGPYVPNSPNDNSISKIPVNTGVEILPIALYSIGASSLLLLFNRKNKYPPA